jgi:hypothetical protein
MQKHDTRAFVPRRIIQGIRQGDVHARRQGVSFSRTIQFDAKDTARTLDDEFIHWQPPATAAWPQNLIAAARAPPTAARPLQPPHIPGISTAMRRDRTARRFLA